MRMPERRPPTGNSFPMVPPMEYPRARSDRSASSWLLPIISPSGVRRMATGSSLTSAPNMYCPSTPKKKLLAVTHSTPPPKLPVAPNRSAMSPPGICIPPERLTSSALPSLLATFSRCSGNFWACAEIVSSRLNRQNKFRRIMDISMLILGLGGKGTT